MAKKRKQKIRYDRVAILVMIAVFIVVSITLILQNHNDNTNFDKKAVWVSYINMEELKNNDEESFQFNFNQICENTKSKGFDTLIVHVRPFMDSMYPSDLYPISPYISSNEEMNYDALENMIEIAHTHNLKFEAWINPYRISYNETQLNYFINHSIHGDWVYTNHILRSGNTAILNPASEEARNYIVSGVKEIVENYHVDGIHMDDYFYVESLFGNTTQVERCENVNILIRQIYETIKSINTNITFGISPQGNLENARNIGADIDTWLSESGYVDYVMPQIYWTDHWGSDGSIEMFSTRVNAYTNLHINKDVKLYAGLALYLAGQDVADDAGWSMDTDNLKRQADLLKEYGWNGYALFDYDSLNEASTQEELNHLLH